MGFPAKNDLEHLKWSEYHYPDSFTSSKKSGNGLTRFLSLMACQREGIGNKMPEQHQHSVLLIQRRTEYRSLRSARRFQVFLMTTEYWFTAKAQ